MGTDIQDLEDLFGGDGGDDEETDAERRRRIREELRQRGYELDYTDSELLDLIGEFMDTVPTDPDAAAEDAFRNALGTPGQGMSGFEQARNAARDAETNRSILDQLINAYTLKTQGGGGPKPSVIQMPDNKELFGVVSSIAAGVSPGSTFRNTFTEAFPDLTQGVSPFAKFVQGQERELEDRFIQQVFNEFSQPGYIEGLKNDYAALERQADNARIAGTGGTIPSYEDFVRNKVQSNYQTFLQQEQPKLQQAFVLASPQERGQNAPGERVRPRRIL